MFNGTIYFKTGINHNDNLNQIMTLIQLLRFPHSVSNLLDLVCLVHMLWSSFARADIAGSSCKNG